MQRIMENKKKQKEQEME